MMKRLFLAVALVFALSQVFASEILHVTGHTKGIDLLGFIREYHMVDIQPIRDETPEHNQGYGMPFDIMGSDVAYNGSDVTIGRRIATWTIASTYAPVTIKVSTTPLKNLGGTVEIHYYLCLRYKYSKFDDSGVASGTEVGNIIVSSNYADEYYNPQKVLENVSTGTSGQVYPILSNSQDVRFMLFDYPNAVKDSWPGGVFSSTVTIEVVGS